MSDAKWVAISGIIQAIAPLVATFVLGWVTPTPKQLKQDRIDKKEASHD